MKIDVREGRAYVHLETTRRRMTLTTHGNSYVVACGKLLGSAGFGVVRRQLGAHRWRLISGPWRTSKRALLAWKDELDRMTEATYSELSPDDD